MMFFSKKIELEIAELQGKIVLLNVEKRELDEDMQEQIKAHAQIELVLKDMEDTAGQNREAKVRVIMLFKYIVITKLKIQSLFLCLQLLHN